jgi:hypothetical protein
MPMPHELKEVPLKALFSKLLESLDGGQQIPEIKAAIIKLKDPNIIIPNTEQDLERIYYLLAQYIFLRYPQLQIPKNKRLLSKFDMETHQTRPHPRKSRGR